MGAGAGSLPAGAGGAGGAGASGSTLLTDIVDTALNPLDTPALAQMLGWIEPPSAEEQLSLRIYLFLLEIIRQEDKDNGALFVKRFLEGPQQIWDANQARIFAIKDLWSVVDIPDEFLPYLKNIVGWTQELSHITDAMDLATLRRLVRNAVALWKVRGSEDAIVSILTLVFGARIRSWNWFDFRWVSEETGFGHESDGYDPWNISIDNDREMNIRIMDDGTLDRQLVYDLINAFRPNGERVEITYLTLLDLFSVDGDDSQWYAIAPLSGDTGSDVITVSGGTAVADDATELLESVTADPVAVPGAQGLTNYVVSARLRGVPSFGIAFHWQDALNWYSFAHGLGELILAKMVAGTITDLATVPLPVGFVDDPTLYYMYRVQVTPEGGLTRIKCYVDGVEVIDTTDGTYSSGTAGFLHVGAATSVECDEFELLELPVESDFVDINS